MCVRVLPVVEQDVWGPDLVCGEAEVFHPGVLALVPLEIMVEPTLQHTEAETVSPLDGTSSQTLSVYISVILIKVINLIILNYMSSPVKKVNCF